MQRPLRAGHRRLPFTIGTDKRGDGLPVIFGLAAAVDGPYLRLWEYKPYARRVSRREHKPHTAQGAPEATAAERHELRVCRSARACDLPRASPRRGAR